jgi:hypothetical protein
LAFITARLALLLLFLPRFDFALREFAHMFALDLALVPVLIGKVFGLGVLLLFKQIKMPRALNTLRLNLCAD